MKEFLLSVWVSLNIPSAKVRIKSEICKKTAKKTDTTADGAIRLCVIPLEYYKPLGVLADALTEGAEYLFSIHDDVNHLLNVRAVDLLIFVHVGLLIILTFNNGVDDSLNVGAVNNSVAIDIATKNRLATGV